MSLRRRRQSLENTEQGPSRALHMRRMRGDVHLYQSAEYAARDEGLDEKGDRLRVARNDAGTRAVAPPQRKHASQPDERGVHLIDRKIDQGHRTLTALLLHQDAPAADDPQCVVQRERAAEVGGSHFAHAVADNGIDRHAVRLSTIRRRRSTGLQGRAG